MILPIMVNDQNERRGDVVYIKPKIISLSKIEIQNMVKARASCSSGSSYCSQGATHCGLGSSYSSQCGSGVIYCSGGNYTGTNTVGRANL